MATLQQSRSHSHRSHHLLRSQTDFSSRAGTPRPVRSHTYHSDETDSTRVPWQHMAHTYTWVVEQEFMTLEKRNRKTEQWILEQQIFITVDGVERRSGRGPRAQRKMWEEMAYFYEIEAEKWMRHEEEARQVAADKERRKARVVQEEVRRIEARIRQKRETERRKLVEERERLYAELRDREKKEKARSDELVSNAWQNYESQWQTLAASPEPLAFSSVPWPVVTIPTRAEDIRPAAIVQLLFSSAHSQHQTRKDRIRSAQLRWHPDRFRRLMGKVKEEDKAEVEEGVGIVARCLNDLMARETMMTRHGLIR